MSKKLHKILVTALVMLIIAATLLDTVGFALEGEPASLGGFDDFTLGNTSLNILNGGIMAEDGDVSYYSEDIEEGAKNLNIIDGQIYYTMETDGGTYIKKLNLSGTYETVLEWGDPIKQMYSVNANTLCILSEGTVYALDIPTGSRTRADNDFEVFGFIPTEYGIIYASGELFDYTLYVDGQAVADSVASYYTDSGYLIVSIGSEDYQIELEKLFGGATEEDFEDFGLYGTVSNAELFSEDDTECDECLANMEAYLDGEITLEEYSESTVTTHSSVVTTAAAVSTGQSNILKRARQQAEIQWTPLKNRPQWGNMGTFKAGTTYTGLPYGQPVQGGFVCFNISLSGFLTAVNNSGSLFYASTATYNKVAPYYSTDCTSFLTYAWGISTRQSTRNLAAKSTKQSQSIYSAQVGDALLYLGSHAILISAVEYDSKGNIITIEILEETPPIVKRTTFGEGGTYTLAQLQKNYLAGSYGLYRYNSRSSVTYTHSHAICLAGDSCTTCKVVTPVIPFTDVSAGSWYYSAVVYAYKNGLFSGTSPTKFSPSAKMTRGMFVTVLGRAAGVSATSYKGTGSFSDVSADAYYASYVDWAVKNGIVSGYGDGKFGPGDPVTREQMCVMLHNYIKAYNITIPENAVTEFADSAKISSWAKTAVTAIQSAGIVSGVGNGNFAPKNTSTRAEVAQMLMTFKGLVG